MIPQEFDYFVPTTLHDALELLSGPDARPLAGGMSLVPLMKLRLAAPGRLIDLRRIPSLRSIRREDSFLHIGAMVTHYEIESAPLIRSDCPLLAAAAAAIGDVQIRNSGTIGGSVAHADPAADYPAALFALEARVQLTGPSGQRELAFEDFLIDTFTTALEPGELVTAIVVPVEEPGTGVYYQKHPQPASGFPMVGVAARVRRENGLISFARVGVTGLSGKGYRARGVELLLIGNAGSQAGLKDAASVVADGVEANADIHASAAYRSHLARVATVRAIRASLLNAD
jgi:aerobic carbon-monoxide dehydrogenase medium subunit